MDNARQNTNKPYRVAAAAQAEHDAQRAQVQEHPDSVHLRSKNKTKRSKSARLLNLVQAARRCLQQKSKRRRLLKQKQHKS